MRNRDLAGRRYAKMWSTLVDLGDPGCDILAGYIAKELLRTPGRSGAVRRECP